MLREIYEKSRYVFEEGFSDWRDAIKASYRPLLTEGIISEKYISSVIKSVEKYGPYIVIAPNIAMPHSSERAEGCKGTAISFMAVKNPVKFDLEDSEKDAKLFFSLTAVDHNQHIENIQALMENLCNEELVSDLLKAENSNMLRKIVEKYK